MSIDIGLLVLRVLIGFVLFVHCTQKLAGWFSGPGLDKAAEGLEALGQIPGKPMAVLASLCELSAAALLVSGLATPLGAATAMGTMLVAGVSLTAKGGSVWIISGGGEYPLVLAAVAGGLAFTGAGSWSIDELLSAPWVGMTEANAAVFGCTAVGLALLAALPPIARMRSSRRATEVQAQ
ncbi:DoxX family protein [Streptomyces sp. NBC_01727]|uniref:DoxX family protein n=1 Tax=Streptomyces sp. NBC_01727 TaxID=2975924 RepID=UPI002E10091D|nr:DoxX family protein [Streptomyces sp. NBC_01727]